MKPTINDYTPIYATKNESEVRKEFAIYRIASYIIVAILLMVIGIMLYANHNMNQAMSDLNIRTAQRDTPRPTHNFYGLVTQDNVITLNNTQMRIEIVQALDTKGQLYYDVLGQTTNTAQFKDELDTENYTYTDEFYFTTQK